MFSSISLPASPRREILLAESQREADDGNAGVVHAFVELLGPQPHLGAAEGVAGLSGGAGKPFVEIFVDDVGFGDHDVAVDQRRHHRAGIKLDIPLLLMFACAQIEMLAFHSRPFSARQSRTFWAQLDISL